MSAELLAVATALEAAAGSSTVTSGNKAGLWSQIAAAAESLAGATTEANPIISGYMLRTAVALESIAGTSPAEENDNYAGYMKRIVDALEVQAGAVETGSLMHRLVLAAQSATFGGGFDPSVQYSPDPEFDNSAAWPTKVRCTVADGGLNHTGLNAPICQGTAAAVIEAGTYRATGVIRAGDGSHAFKIGNFGGGTANLGYEAGPFSVDFVVPATSQNVRLDGDTGNIGELESCFIHRIA